LIRGDGPYADLAIGLSRSFLTSELAGSFKAELKAAARRGESFDEATGLPDSILRRDRDITWYQHAQEYAAAR
jgi:hypothetical protein